MRPQTRLFIYMSFDLCPRDLRCRETCVFEDRERRKLEMAKLFENNYRHNPYVYGMVNVLSSFCRDYNEANRALEKYPNDTRSMMVRTYCVDFANWLSETTEMDYGSVGELIVRMMEAGSDEK